MANADSLSQQTGDAVSNYRIGIAKGVTLNTVQNGLVTIPILSGGLTNGGAAGNSGGVIVRRITVQNPTGSLASTYISAGVTNGGATIVANSALSSITSNATFQDMTTTATYVAGSTTQCLYVNVNVVSGNANTADIVVWGDVVKF